MADFLNFLYSQIFITPKPPTRSFTNETVIVTGANSGLGLEACRHLLRLNCAHLIMACRNTTAGEAARQDVLSTNPSVKPSTVEVWPLDLADPSSMTAFAKKAEGLKRLDAALLNAGIATGQWNLAPATNHEMSIQVNLLGTMLLALLLIPTLEASATKHPNTTPRLTIVSSNVHTQSTFEQRKAPKGQIFAALNDKSQWSYTERYPLSKLLSVLATKYGLCPRLAARPNNRVIVNYTNPGLCHSELAREGNFAVSTMKTLIGRTTEVGSRTIMAGICGGEETDGKYLSVGLVREERLSAFVRSEEGKKAGERLWGEMVEVLEGWVPGVKRDWA